MAESEAAPPSRNLFLLASTAILAGFAGAAGFAPFVALAEGKDATIELAQEMLRDRAEVLDPIVYEGSGLVTYVPEKSQPGLTLVQGVLPGGPQIRMLDREGKEVHRWTADFFAVWPEASERLPERRMPKSKYHYFIQGMLPMQDGSIVVSFGELGSARLDACSRPIWRTQVVTHHSITPAGDGKFWIPGQISVFETPPNLLPNGYPAERIDRLIGTQYMDYNNSVMLVDAAGRVEKEFSILQAIKDAGLEHALYSSFRHNPADPTHLNDIEVVTPELAERIAGVEPGNLLLSLRDMHMLAIISEKTGKLLWHQIGPWVSQHDPDILPDGTIELFNNRSQVIGDWVDTSQIIHFDPATREAKTMHPVTSADRFFSPVMGAHQRLDNGNRLITESTAGRVFEVTPTGEIVWDYRLPYDEEVASLFTIAERVPEGFYKGVDFSCSNSAN